MNISQIALIALLAGAGQAHAQDSQALSTFEKIAAGCKAAFEAQPLEDVVFIPPTKKWSHRLFSRADVVYDVQRTTSLVSPYQATIKITQRFNSARADDEAGARAATVVLDDSALKTVDVLTFAFQDGRWQLTGGETADLSAGGGAKVRRTPEAWSRMKSPVTSCLGSPG